VNKKRGRKGWRDVRAASTSREEGLQHVKVGEIKLGEDHAGGVDSCGA